jgi:UPF0755 protein
MIDELDLAFDQQSGRTPQRHRRKRSGGKSAVAFLLVLLLFGLLGGGVWYGFDKVRDFFAVADYPGPGSGEVQVDVKQGASLTEIGNALVEQDVVKSSKAFTNAAEKNSKSKNIQVGSYRLKKQMSGEQAVTALLDGKNRQVKGVTIPEGLSYQQVFQKLSETTKIPVAEFEAAGKDPIGLGVPDFWFNRSDGKPADKTKIEGFLYPDTYEFPKDADATTILRTMVEHFNTKMQELGFVDKVQNERKISPYEALIAASIAQGEAMKDEDMGKVARVLYNRAYTDKFPCKCLGLDSTVNYWLRINGKGGKASEKLKVSELHDPNNPFNTHDFPGMPVGGPIGNPGAAALKGAMEAPPSGDFYFISVDNNGTMAYAKDDAGHQANIQQACKNGLPICNIK